MPRPVRWCESSPFLESLNFLSLPRAPTSALGSGTVRHSSPWTFSKKGLTDARQRLTPPSVSGSSAKPADENAQHQNLRVFSVESGEEVMAFVQKGQENW